ncbi:MAG: glycosyltransferase family 2 protein [Clostridia bacterium]|nr:glycosyltransferase family 2 protein [Clostridia bacterium]
MVWVEVAIRICSLIGTVLTVLYAYKGIIFLVGLFGHRKFKPTERRHRYGICVAARNEERVIENFLQSVARQDYPVDKITVFIVAHNCTDRTAQIARAFRENGLQVVVYEYDAPKEKTKGFALQYLFKRIGEGYGIESFDGYFVFDADNVISQSYVTKMNEAFDEGNKIVTSFRSSKNANQNWISFGYAMHWMRTCLAENRGKGILKQACRIQGTGFLFANELVKNGWKYTTLTEDRSFCTDAVVQNYRISYCDEAVFYDEQPYRLKVALRQRLRWAKGHLQSTVENCPKLIQNMFRKNKNFTITYDCFWLNFPRSVESGIRKLIKILLELWLAVYTTGIFGWWKGLFIAWGFDVLTTLLGNLAMEIAVLIVYRKRIERENIFKRVFHMCMFPLFDVVGTWSSYVALFKKVEWKPIPHDRVVDIERLNNT